MVVLSVVPVDGPVGGPAVVRSVVRLAVSCPVTRFGRWSGRWHTPYNGRPASDACARSGAAVVLQCCGRVAVVPVDGPVGGPVGGVVLWSGWPSGRWSGQWSGRWSGLWSGQWSSLSSGPRGLFPSKHVLLHTMACQLQMLGYWSQGACVSL